MKCIYFFFFCVLVMVVCVVVVMVLFLKVMLDDLKVFDGLLMLMGVLCVVSKDNGVLEWLGKWFGMLFDVQYKCGGCYFDLFVNEKLIVMIIVDNMVQYVEYLIDGQKVMFKCYLVMFKINVYLSYCDFCYIDFVYKDICMYVFDLMMMFDVNGLINVLLQVFYLILKMVVELLWNQCMLLVIGVEQVIYDQVVVYFDGNIVWGKVCYDIYLLCNVGKYDVKNDLNNCMFYCNVMELLLFDCGLLIVGFQNWDKVGVDNVLCMWMYNFGIWCVCQVLEYGYDQLQGLGGFCIVDDDCLYNGFGDCYDWKIVGKCEIYVLYDNYKVMDSLVKYVDLLIKGYENLVYICYELYCVWVLQVMLKSNYCYQYVKCVLYIDEDFWMMLFVDNYDVCGQLWCINVVMMLYVYDVKMFYLGVVFFYDLIFGVYMVDCFINEGLMLKFDNSLQFSEVQFLLDVICSLGN